jgi:hypothetical protein
VAAFDFWYSVFALDKSRLTGPDFQNKTSIYKWTVKLAFESIFDHLRKATVVFDRCGGREFTRQLKTYLRQAMNEKAGNPDHGRIKRVRDDRSASNNLLQMADMVCGAVARSFSAIKTDHDRYRDIIREREREVKVWTGA